jgi:hypothetical protein
MLGTEKRGLCLVVVVDVGQNGGNSGADRSGPAHILDPGPSVCLPYFQHSVLYSQNYV